MGGLATRIGILLLAFGLAGCASAPRNPQDPLEGFNRAMFTFNDKVDQVALKPASEIYQSTLPPFVQTTVGNFFGNLADIPTFVNEVLQGKFSESLSDFMRVTVNSTLGLGGLLDIASEANMPKHSEDFGQTLGRWGVASGPYVVLPILGPSTVRDTIATPIDFSADPWLRTYPVNMRNTGSFIRVIDQRSVALNASNLVEEAALDRYEFVRDAYLQRRESRIFDGDVPQKKTAPSSSIDGDDSQAAAPATAPAAPVTEPQAAPVVKTEQNASIPSAKQADAAAASGSDASKVSMSALPASATSSDQASK
jgi:phospholipid-binding lipoprotein MlaA